MESRVQGSRPRTQKTSKVKDSPSEDRPFLGQGQRCNSSSKKKKIIKIIRSSNLFFMRFKKKRSQNFFSGDFQKKVKKSPKKQGLSNNFSSDLQNFKDSKNTAVLQPKTGQFLRT